MSKAISGSTLIKDFLATRKKALEKYNKKFKFSIYDEDGNKTTYKLHQVSDIIIDESDYNELVIRVRHPHFVRLKNLNYFDTE